MVLEQLFRKQWITRKPQHAFMLALAYGLIGIVSAMIIFGADPGMMAVAFTAILLIPSLNSLLQREENVEIRERKLSLRLLVKDHRDILEIYVFLFFGVFCAFALSSIVLGAATEQFFGPQLAVAGIGGHAFNADAFWSLLVNNALVLSVCLLLSLIYGAGSILFLSWNASVWGTIFGYLATQAPSTPAASNPIGAFILLILPVIPHMLTESISYVSASIVGGVVSKAVLREKLGSKRFNHVLTDALMLLGLAIVLVVIAALIESRLM